MALESARAELVGVRVRKLFLTKSKWLPYDGTVTAVNEDGEGLHITIQFDDGEVWVADTETEGEAQTPLEVVRGFARAFADGEDEVKPSKPASKRKAGSLAPEQPAKQARRARAAESEEDDAGGAEAESEDEDAPRKKAKAKPKPAAAGKKGGKSACVPHSRVPRALSAPSPLRRRRWRRWRRRQGQGPLRRRPRRRVSGGGCQGAGARCRPSSRQLWLTATPPQAAAAQMEADELCEHAHVKAVTPHVRPLHVRPGSLPLTPLAARRS